MTMEGGIRMPSVPPAASSPSTNFFGYPRAVISGTAMVPIVAAVATDEPEIAANRPQEMMVATPRPPGQWPTHDCAAANNCWPAPHLSRMFDISRNSGMASSTKLSMLE